MDAKQLAYRLGIPVTLRGWIEKLGIEVERTRSGLRFDDEAVQVMDSVKRLRDQSCGFTTIRHQLGLVSHERVEREEVEGMGQDKLLKELLEAHHRLGQLETELRILNERLISLPAPDEWHKEQNKIVHLETESKLLKSSWWYRLFGKIGYTS
jgi:DNA-binding transcriptional MerR regulator